MSSGDPRQPLLASAITPFLKELGYAGALLHHEVRIGSGLIVPIVAFAHPPADARTACVAVVEADVGSAELVARYRSLATPIVLVCGRQGLEWWRQSSHQPLREGPPIPPDRLTKFFNTHASDFTPDAVYRAKTWGRFDQQHQLSFVDLGLMPLVEEQVGRELEQLIVRNVQRLKSILNWDVLSDKKGQWLLKSVFWLVSAKILKDKKVGQFSELDLSDVEPLLSAVAEHFGAVPIPIANQRQQKALTEIADGITDFSNLQLATTESLAYVYENTLISKATRQSLGTHSTPTYLVDYIVGKLRPWIEDIPLNERNVFEPACGHAAFLVSAMRLLTELLPEDKSSPSQRRTYLRKRIHGCDVDDFALEIARLSLSLTDIPNPNGWNLVPGDMFRGDVLEQQSRTATILLANPPFENFGVEERGWYAKKNATPRHTNKTAEMLSRVLSQLPAGAVIGVVVPQGFLHSKNATEVRRHLLRNFELSEVCLFPDKVFTFSEMESAVLIARKHDSTARPLGNVRYRHVREREMRAFRQDYSATSESVVESSRLANDLSDFRVLDLQVVWDFLRSLPFLQEFATVGKGLQYSTKPPSGLKTISDTRFSGAVRGFSRFEPDLPISELPREVWMSLDPRCISVARHGTKVETPQVIFNEIRTSRGPWRLKALIDVNGHALTGSFNVARTHGPVTIEWLWAVLNSPLANALVHCSSNNKHNQASIFRRMRVPALHNARISEISSAARDYLDYVRHDPDKALQQPISLEKARLLLLRVDCEVLRAYDLPRELEWQLLNYFAGWPRGGLPFNFDRYFPEHFTDHISLTDYLAITADWPTTNRRRETLIRKKIARAIDGQERNELDHLQSLASSRVRLFAPLPFKELEAVHKEVVGAHAE